MKKRELYYEKIIVNEDFYFQIDQHTCDCINIYKKNDLVYQFALNRKIYTFFKVLHDLIDDENYVIVEDTNAYIYGEEIHLYDNIFMKINANHACLTLDFIEKTEEGVKLVYLIKLIYTVQKLFSYMLVPQKLRSQKSYYVTNVFKFLDMIEILSYENKSQKTT